jgi:hypothetical protein
MKIICLLAASLSFYSSVGFGAADYKVIDHREQEGIGQYRVLIPASEFREEVLVGLANQFLHRYAQLSFLDVGFYTDAARVQDFVGIGVTEVNFAGWLEGFEARRKQPLPCGAEILKSGTAATLRIRYPDGHIEEVLIHSGNVFHPVIKGVRLDLLHVLCVFQRRGSWEPKLTPQLYFSVSKYITPREGGAIARSILESSGAPRMEINIRPDKWFMCDPFYPWINPFAPVDSAPTPEARRAWQLSCDTPKEQVCFQTIWNLSSP